MGGLAFDPLILGYDSPYGLCRQLLESDTIIAIHGQINTRFYGEQFNCSIKNKANLQGHILNLEKCCSKREHKL